ncbi:MAG: hypothetical protein A3G87_06405 [Omnitrophica bacterium RIFCSPLOWO2_12_FULL_50_11]|nr:MAG: hypothetical protein A3G87_06405 [Omnitrophica bacterium RIFCSPLOWO2_12_FULL_50_11]
MTTVSKRKEALKIARVLVRERLAACVNIVPAADSVFRWQGRIDRARELLLIVKTDAPHLKRIEETIRTHHSYQVPEMIAWPIAWGHQPYLDWLSSAVR